MRKLLVLNILLGSCIVSKAQELYSIEELTSIYEKEQNVQFSFDPEFIGLVNAKFSYEKDLPEFISKVESSLPLSIRKVGDRYYSIGSTSTEYSIRVSDSTNGSLVNPAEVIILVKGKPISSTFAQEQVVVSLKPSVRDTVMVYAIGYNKKIVPIEDLLNQKSLSISIHSPLMRLSEVIVKDYLTKGINLNPSNQSISISLKDLPLLPGETDGDIFASLTALPGITNPDGRAGNLFVRGSDPDQTMILFDNIPVYHRGHYYGTISPYNPKIVDEVEVHRNGFHPRLGGRVGGAILINSNKGVSNEPITGVGVNTLFGMIYTKLPLAQNKIGISIGIRRSYPDAIQSPKLVSISESVFDGTGLVDGADNLTGDVDVLFEDYNWKIAFQPNDRNNLSLSGIYTNTDVVALAEIGTNPTVPERNQFENVGANLDWKYDLGNNWNFQSSATFSKYNYRYVTQLPNLSDPIYKAINELTDINFRQEFSKKEGNLFWCQIGVDYKWQEASIDFFNNPPSGMDVYTLKNSVNSHSLSPFANLEYFGFEKWYFQLGLRGTYFSQLNDFRIAPRLLVNYDANDWFTLKGSIGAYNQYLSQVKNLEFGGGGFENELWSLADDDQGHIIDGRQAMIGALIHRNKWIFDIEAFNKSANNITIYEDRRLADRHDYFTMDQRNYGVDFMLKRQIGDEASMWIGYSHNESEIKLDSTAEATYKSKYVQPDVWYVGGAFQRNRWKLSAAYKYSSGLNAESLDIIYAEILRLRAIANSGGGMPLPDPFANRSSRYSSMQSFDLSASYKIPKSEKRKWSATFGLSFINLFDQEILVDQVFRGMMGFQDREALGFAPNLMVTFEW